MRSPLLLAAIAAVAALSAVPASATDMTYRYPDLGKAGTQNADLYRFTATSDGLLSGYYMGSTAGYDETLSLKVNGNLVAGNVFQNHTTPNFTRLDFGNVRAGDVLEFLVNVTSTGDVFSSDVSLNSDGINHIFASSYAGEPWIGVPGGTFVGFEDLLGGGDLNYNDLTFVFTNVTAGRADGVGAVPEPATWATMLLGFGLVGLLVRSRRRLAGAASF